MNITEIIAREKIIIKYQPIISTHNKNFMGFEALVRGCSNRGEISPYSLFNEATLVGKVLELDKLCIRKSIEGFTEFFRYNNKTVLFINIDASVLEYYICHDYIEKLVKKNHISAGNIVLEINELPAFSLEKMKDFSNKYKGLGFLIALDDIGAGESNLDRIPLIRPDIIKIDKDLIQGLGQSFHSKQVVGTIIDLATNLGALVVIEGVEFEEDITHIAEFGAHLIQGYLLGKPNALTQGFYRGILENKAKMIKSMYTYIKSLNDKKRWTHDYMSNISSKMISAFESKEIEEYKVILQGSIYEFKDVESVYILDKYGKLVIDTIFNKEIVINSSNPLYTPCEMGDSVELEEYYTKLVYGGYPFWVSNEYISMASGNKCYTYSSILNHELNESYIICIDFNSNKMNQKLINLQKVVNYA